jgi:hypothetical protein
MVRNAILNTWMLLLLLADLNYDLVGSVTTTLLPEDYVSSSNVDLFHYHNDESTRGKWALNHPSHSDSGIITFIPCSKVAALEFLDQVCN